MLTETTILPFLQVVFDHAVEKSGFSDTIASWLKKKPQELAFKIALTRAYNRFADKHPSWAGGRLFDEHFFNKSAAPLLARCLPPADAPKAEELVDAWARQLTGTEPDSHLALPLSVASDFLGLFEDELRARPEFQPLFDSNALKMIERSTTQTADGIDKLREELNQALNVLIALQFHSMRPMEQTSNNRQPLPISPRALPAGAPLIAAPADNGRQKSSDVRPTSPATELNAPKPTTEARTIHRQPKEDSSLWGFLAKVWEIILTRILLLRRTEPQNQADFDWLKQLKPPVGAVDDQFYVKRDADTEFKRLIPQEGTTIIIRGPRQTGKSSLLAQGVRYARESGIQVVHFDLQSLENADIKSYERFLRALADSIVEQLGLDLNEVEQEWSQPRSKQDKLSTVLVNYVLPKSDKPMMLALDDVDRLLKFDFHTDFFSLLRSWHNIRATDSRWKKLNMVLVISTEPHLLMADQHRSPFNVGEPIYLEDFSQEQVSALNQWHDSPVKESQIPDLMALLNGHPYLTHRVLYTLVTRSWSWSKLMDVAISDNGPFDEHLRHYYRLLRHQHTLKRGLKQVIDQQRCPEKAFDRLKRAGLLTGSHKQATFRCDLYRRYFDEKGDSHHFGHSYTKSTSEPKVKSFSKPQEKALTWGEKTELVQHLLVIPSIADHRSRATVINQLCPQIKTNLVRNPVDKIDVLNMVETCLQYLNGMQELREILQFFEGDSIPMQQFNEALNRLLPIRQGG